MAEVDGKSRTSLSSLQNYHNTKGFETGKSFSKTSALKANITAFQLLYTLQEQKRAATPNEQEILARYVGFGGLKEILLNPSKDNEWLTESDKKLRPLVQQLYEIFEKSDPDCSIGLLPSARRSILNAHYTSYPIVTAIYEAIEKAGFTGGNILEPSAGIGNFLAAMPEAIANQSNVTAIEMDSCTGMILQKLFPTATTHLTGFEKLNFPENHFDLVISNIPFGDVPIFDTQLANHKDKKFKEACNNIHNYFFAKSLLLAKPGGMIGFITSRYTLDSVQNKNIREIIHAKAAFLGAIRLPNTAFKANAGTEVVTDIIFLKKFELGEKAIQKHGFINVKSEPFSDDNGVSGMLTYNEYFHDNPSHLVGTKEFGGLYRKDEFNLKGDPAVDIKDVIVSIADKIFQGPVLKPSIELDGIKNLLPSVSEGSSVSLSDFDSIGNLVLTDSGIAGIISAEAYIDPALDERAKNLGINPQNIRDNKPRDYEYELLRENGLRPEDFHLKVIEPLRVNKGDLPKLKDMITLRKLTKELLFKEMNHFPDAALEPIRNSLHRAYAKFTMKFGNLLHKNNEKILFLSLTLFRFNLLVIRCSVIKSAHYK